MTERCPLVSGLLYWEFDSPHIPEVCMTSCENSWNAAANSQVPDTDDFSESDTLEVHASVEYGDTSLQRGFNAGRYVAFLYVYPDGVEAYADEYAFSCQNN